MPKRRAWGAAAALLVLAIVLAACGGGGGNQPQSPAPQQQSSSGASSQVREVKVTLSDFQFEPEEIVVKRGEKVRLVLENKGTVAHDWTVQELNLVSPKVQPGQSATFEFTVDRAATFTSVCVEPGHEALGMVGKLVVED